MRLSEIFLFISTGTGIGLIISMFIDAFFYETRHQKESNQRSPEDQGTDNSGQRDSQEAEDYRGGLLSSNTRSYAIDRRGEDASAVYSIAHNGGSSIDDEGEEFGGDLREDGGETISGGSEIDSD